MDILKSIWDFYVYTSVFFTTMVLIKAYMGIRDEYKKIRENKHPTPTSSDLIKLVYIENHEGIMYLYDALTKSFIAQSADRTNLIETAQQRFPKFKIILTELDNKT